MPKMMEQTRASGAGVVQPGVGIDQYITLSEALIEAMKHLDPTNGVGLTPLGLWVDQEGNFTATQPKKGGTALALVGLSDQAIAGFSGQTGGGPRSRAATRTNARTTRATTTTRRRRASA